MAATVTTKASYSSAAPAPEDYEAKQLPTYQAQEDKVNETYDAKQEADIAALKGAYDASMLEADANLEKIPGAYQKQANALSAEAEKQRRAFNEYAAGSGVNSGAGSQAQLAMSNQYQGDMSSLRESEANAIASAQLEITKIKTQYQDSVAAAVAENDYQRAAALLSEYQTQAKSIVDTAQAQADEDYRAWQAALDNQRYTAEWERTEQQRQTELAQDMIEKTLAAGYSADYIVSKMPEAFQASGYDVDYLNAMASYYYWQTHSSGSSSSGGSGGNSYQTPYTPPSTSGDESNKYYQMLKNMADKGTNSNIMSASLTGFPVTTAQKQKWAKEFGLTNVRT